jgi:hypothetical protein
MLLELSADEAVALRDFLTSRLGDLSAEISHTDNPAFRRDLRQQRDHLLRVHEVLVRLTPPAI